jgi:galactosamine-6-phosphate isomerase
MNPRSDNPRTLVANSYRDLSRMAATIILAELEAKPDLLLCASAGGTPTGAYARLAARYKRQPALFRELRVLQIDEWGGLPPKHPASCETDLRRKLLEPLQIKPNRYTGFRSDAAKPARECERMDEWVGIHGPIDVCLLGLGVNGHVAMNEPGDVLTPTAHVAELARASLQHAMLRNLKPKPRYGLTLGIGEILRSKKIILLVSGATKRAALRRLSKREVTTRFPASFIWLHANATLICDRDAMG